jgi:predicted ATPase
LPEKAVAYWRRAAENATRRSAATEAIGQLTAALVQLAQLPEGRERAKLELALQRLLGQAALQAKGFGSPEAITAFGRARELCQAIGDEELVAEVLFGVWLFELSRAEHAKAYATAGELLKRADRGSDEEVRVAGNSTTAISELHVGAPMRAHYHFEKSIAIGHTARDKSEGRRGPPDVLVHRFLMDLVAAARGYDSWCLWLLGHPDRASRRADEAIAMHQGSHFSYARTLYWRSVVPVLRRDWPMARQRAEQLIDLARERGFSMLLALGRIVRGAALEETETAPREIRDGIAAFRATGCRYQTAHHLCWLAQALMRCGRYDEALAVMREAAALSDETGERYFAAEIRRLKGNLLLACGANGSDAAEICYREALEVARAQQARSLELRAARDLAWLWCNRGKRAEAQDLLTPVYGWFTEGFDTADLKEAKALLDQLA